jgi:uncharacterized protein (DUF1684 family)
MMDDPTATATLWDYRRRVADLYAEVRRTPDPATAWHLWRSGREQLFADHPQSPIEPERRHAFTGLDYFSYDPAWRLVGLLEPVAPLLVGAGHSGSGETPMRRFARAAFTADGDRHSLSLYWLEGYGGGVFVPFRDATSQGVTYGGGRYLLDTAKGADLGSEAGEVILDFNFAYHPSCVHSPRWSCPLAPPENTLPIAVRAGERLTAQTTE